VVWLRGFVAIGEVERRRYVGWSGCAAEPDDDLDANAWARALPAVMERLRLPGARPFGPGDAALVEKSSLAARMPSLIVPTLGELDGPVARAVAHGGLAMASDPHEARLPALFGQLFGWLPLEERIRPRTGAIGTTSLATTPEPEPERNLYHYLARSWQTGTRAPWRLVLDLATSEGLPLLELFAQLTPLASRWERAGDLHELLQETRVLTPEELALAETLAPAPLLTPDTADAGRLWNRVLGYWGRGFFGAEHKAELADRLARMLARRIVIDHLVSLDVPGHGNPRRYLERLRFESLLSRRDVATLQRAVLRLLPSLEVTRERA
jgi:hypothetical protein